MATPRHGLASTYQNHACRCAPCTEAQRLYGLRWRARYAAERVLIDGRLTAPHGNHGQPGMYTGRMCRCRPCTDAHTAASRRRTEARRGQQTP